MEISSRERMEEQLGGASWLTEIPLEAGGGRAGRRRADGNKTAVGPFHRWLYEDLVAVGLRKEVDQAVIGHEDDPGLWESIENVDISNFMVKSTAKGTRNKYA